MPDLARQKPVVLAVSIVFHLEGWWAGGKGWLAWRSETLEQIAATLLLQPNHGYKRDHCAAASVPADYWSKRIENYSAWSPKTLAWPGTD